MAYQYKEVNMEINLDFVRIAQKHSAKEKAKAKEREILAEREARAKKYHRSCIIRKILDNIVSFCSIIGAGMLIYGMAYIVYILTSIKI